MSEQDLNLPEEQIRVGGTVTASIWRNEMRRGDRTVQTFAVQLQRRYFDKADQTWKTSKSFFADDLPKAELALHKAYEYIMIKSDADADDCRNSAA